VDTSPEQRLYDAAARGDNLIAAAAQAIAAGLNSPSLRALAASPEIRTRRARSLLFNALDELSIPRPDPREPGQVVGGTSYARLPTDTLRLTIADGELGPEVLISINDTKIAEPVGGMGMHPFDLFVPSNQLLTATKPRRVVVGRCACGEPGCGSTEALISRAGDAVHWDWYGDAPMNHGASFDATQYDAEVERIGNDRSWRVPIDSMLEVPDGMEVSWAGADYRDPQQYLVALFLDEERFLIYLRFPMDSPVDVLRTLRQPPSGWRATYRSLVVGRVGRPSMGGWRWRSEDAWG
jgi:hypothetical protein